NSFKPGIGNKMIAALRRVGLLHGVNDVPGETPTYGAIPTQEQPYEIIGIRDTWLHWYQVQNGQPAGNGRRIAAKERVKAKERIKQLARGQLRQMTVIVFQEGQDLVAYTPRDHRLGTVQPGKGQSFRDGQQFRIQHALAEDGHLRLAVRPLIEKEPHSEKGMGEKG
ncbi:MAG: hypothetical protein GY796_32305, partial [Chloroflexi bacterium]|nr:hypothetical protein [Chloroflexota bacterium]